jgi:hypothetical protein
MAAVPHFWQVNSRSHWGNDISKLIAALSERYAARQQIT